MSNASSRQNKTVVQVFSRYPRKGKVKTRMTPFLSENQAFRLQHLLLQYILGVLQETSMETQLWLDDLSIAAKEEYPEARQQHEGDLGEKMYFATKEVLDAENPVILIGSDCPFITAELLEEVEERLHHTDVILVPAMDGGYVLIALGKSSKRLFEDINWGTDQVTEQTLQRIKETGFSSEVLLPFRDIDVPDDLAFLLKDKVFCHKVLGNRLMDEVIIAFDKTSVLPKKF